jgi:hypothetical protein
MPTSWNSLFWLSNDSEGVARALCDSLTALGYELFNPFGLIPGKAYPHSVRLFVALPVDGWVKVIGALDERQLSLLKTHNPYLYLTLNEDQAAIRVFVDGQPVEAEPILVNHLKPGLTAADLQAALRRPHIAKVSPLDEAVGGVPMEALPQDVQALARQVNPRDAQRLISRLSEGLLKRTGGEAQASAARALIEDPHEPDWNSPGGILIRALMNCLTLPINWREPDFITLRDAYALHERKRRNPNARAYPGDDDVMAQVPDALSYIPVYGGLS